MAKKTKKTATVSTKNESPEARFMRLAIPRVQAAVKRIQLVSNLAGAGYVSTPEQKTKVIKALVDAVSAAEDRFNKVKAKEELFTL